MKLPIMTAVTALSLSLAFSSTALAQDEEGGEAPATEEAATEAPAEEAPKAAGQPTSLTQEKPLEIRRGFFAETDLGLFFTFGGRNTNLPEDEFPKKTISNLQPYIGATFGYDIAYSDSYSFALGAKLGIGYSSGAGRVTDDELATLSTQDIAGRSADFAVMQTSLVAMLAIMLGERVALTAKLDGGAGFVDPDPTKSPGEEGAGGAAFAPVVGASLGAEFFTLLNDFSVGIEPRFAMVLLSGSTIPSASLTFPIKYTF